MIQQRTSINSSPNSSNPVFLEDSSLITPQPWPIGSSSVQPLLPPPPEQKLLSPAEPTLAAIDSQGRINLSVPASTFKIVRQIGKGGFGIVYEAVYAGKAVAVKQINTNLSSSAFKELKHEAEIMFQLGLISQHIVKVIKICLKPPSLVMELMPKGSLYDLLRNGQDLPWTIRYQIALDAVSGLYDLHEYKIIHRDLKSLNILLDDRLRAKLADFGLAKVKHESGNQFSVSQNKVGTLLWMAPELFEDVPKITQASDIYSFGKVLWELVTRKLPYTKWNPPVSGAEIFQGEQEEIPTDCPPKLQPIIESCLELTPSKRPTAFQVMESLKPLVELKTPPPDNYFESEVKKLKVEMEQMKLAQEQQSAQLAAVEAEKLRLTEEKKAEIERIKYQYQAELKRAQQDPKNQLQVQSLMESTPPPTPGFKSHTHAAAKYYETQGIFYERAKDYKLARNVYEAGVVHGSVRSKTNLADLLLKGRGGEKDKSRAAVLLKEASKAGHVRAMYNLALMLKMGDGITSDAKEAFNLFRLAAEREHPESMYQLAKMLEVGEGALVNMEQARYWFEKAKRAGYPKIEYQSQRDHTQILSF